MPTITLSLLVVASGTCLPELVVAMVVARKGQALSTVVFLVISLTNAWTYTARHGYFLLVLYFLFNVYVVLDAIPQTNVPGPSGI